MRYCEARHPIGRVCQEHLGRGCNSLSRVLLAELPRGERGAWKSGGFRGYRGVVRLPVLWSLGAASVGAGLAGGYSPGMDTNEAKLQAALLARELKTVSNRARWLGVLVGLGRGVGIGYELGVEV